jgi:adenylate cyclase, class 2
MGRETEIKLAIADEKALRRALQKLKAVPVSKTSPRVHELNVLFDTEDGALAKRGQLMRIRTETTEPPRKAGRAKSKASDLKQRVVLTFKRPVDGEEPVRKPHGSGRYKVREELELEVSDGGTLTKIFDGLRLDGWFRYEKYRTTYKLGAAKTWGKELLVEVDETPVGTFVELEGPAEAIDKAAEALGFSKRDYISKSYLELYVEECRRRGEQPRHMLFAAANRKGK